MRLKVIGIDDEESIVQMLKMIFEMHPEVAPNFELFTEPEKLLKALTPDVHICIIDYYLKGITGLELIKKIIKKNPYCWFIMLSGQKKISVIVEFMNNSYGTRYIEKGKDDVKERLLFFIKDIRHRIEAIENYYSSSGKFKESFSELKESITELKKD